MDSRRLFSDILESSLREQASAFAAFYKADDHYQRLIKHEKDKTFPRSLALRTPFSVPAIVSDEFRTRILDNTQNIIAIYQTSIRKEMIAMASEARDCQKNRIKQGRESAIASLRKLYTDIMLMQKFFLKTRSQPIPRN